MSSRTSLIMPPPSKTDVIIIGAGPAGLMSSLCFNTFGLDVVHLDERAEPTTAGRADGIQPRTLEVLRNIGSVDLVDEPGDVDGNRPPFNGASLAQEMIRQGVRVYEVAFWDPTENEPLARTSRAASCPDFIDVEDNYTLLLHQGRIEKAFLDEIEARRLRIPPGNSKAPEGGVYRSYSLLSCKTLPSDHDELASTHPVEAVVAHSDTQKHYTIRAKYLMGCDGARSLVRRSIAGGQVGDGEWQGKITMQGEGTDIVWGVIDAHIDTDFPDLHYKCLIHSKESGSIMVIPRESSLVRFYVQLQSTDENGKSVHVERSKATQDICIETAKKIFAPYHLEFGYVDWFSVYQIGQRIASNYTLDHRIFLGGDATHTHSPKAGQGMNISMLDMYSLAWKINLVEKGIGNPEILLPSYEQERRSVAQELLKFDSYYSRLFSGRGPKDAELTDDVLKTKKLGAVDAQKFIEAFKANARFTSGCGAVYSANALNALPDSEVIKGELGSAFNPKGSTLVCGERLNPGQVVRVADANQVSIQQEIKMNGAFRIHVLAGELDHTMEKLKAFSDHINSSGSFLNHHRPKFGSRASMVDGLRPKHGDKPTEFKTIGKHRPNPFFTFLTIVATHYHDWEISDLPETFSYYRYQVYGDCLFDRRVAEAGIEAPLHRKYGIEVNKGAIVVVRPDGYIGAVVDLEEKGWKALDVYFSGFLVDTSS